VLLRRGKTKARSVPYLLEKVVPVFEELTKALIKRLNHVRASAGKHPCDCVVLLRHPFPPKGLRKKEKGERGFIHHR